MNTSILVGSFKYLDISQASESDPCNLMVSLASWINQELIQINYTDVKLITSFNRNDFDIAETIIDYNEDKTVLDNILTSQDNCNNIKLLLDHGADIHAENDFMLRNACLCGKIEIVKLLLQYDADITVLDYEALDNACWCRDIVDLLLMHNIYDKCALYYAIYYGASVEVVRSILAVTSLVDYKVKMWYMYHDSDMLLRHACDISNIEVIRVLIEHGADIHNLNDCCFRLAVYKGKIDLVKYFLSIDIGGFAISKAINDLKHYTNSNTEMIELLKSELNQ